MRTWPEFPALRDIIFFWKYFMCPLAMSEEVAIQAARQRELFRVPGTLNLQNLNPQTCFECKNQRHFILSALNL